MSHHLLVYSIALLATLGVIIRPFRVPEAVWAVSGALLLLIFRLISPADAWTGVLKGGDVYLFLTGMMMLAEVAREEGLFDWLAAHAVRFAKGSPGKLFLLVYGVGTVVTVLLSNDATAVVLTPAVAAAVRAAKVKNPLPYLFVCAFVANAASFVLPISNPANLVIYGRHMPALGEWLRLYALPSLAAIGVTCAALYATQRRALPERVHTDIAMPVLTLGGVIALAGIGVMAAALIAASALDKELGLPTALAGGATASAVFIAAKRSPMSMLRGIFWSVLPLVSGLFVIVEALNEAGLVAYLGNLLERQSAASPVGAAWGSGLATAFACNAVNNLPAGLIAGSAVQLGQIPEAVRSSVLIGIDLGPNLSVTGSLATILWLVALRREGIAVSAGQFLRIGAIVMTVALLAALAAVWI